MLKRTGCITSNKILKLKAINYCAKKEVVFTKGCLFFFIKITPRYGYP